MRQNMLFIYDEFIPIIKGNIFSMYSFCLNNHLNFVDALWRVHAW